MTTFGSESERLPTAPAGALARELAFVKRHEQTGVIVADVEGEIDISNVAEIGRELTDISNQVLGLVVNLDGVGYLDSAGIAMLYELQLRLGRRGQVLAVVAPVRGAPRRVLELVAFDKQAVVADDVDAAVATVRGRGHPHGR